MADGAHIPEIRLGFPIVQDFAYIAANMRPDEIAQYLALTGISEYAPDVAARSMIASPGHQFVMVNSSNLPVLVGGFCPVRAGVFEGWAAGTPDGWATHWRAITKVCRGLLDDLMANGAHRVETFALASRTQAHEWYERSLLMQREGVLRGYFADGQDAIVFSRVSA
ncbi:hypothetical protein EAH88_11870 [Rhodanobacter glycinis]|uniref:GNAT family N-acetyltransferase n=1 Tax=Rhodanobacter glycinis TaxID=582702 RepID=A0A502C987_9GAMM|nr:hypothetical protein [Rhodanobacter glycinis]TPG08321.1 hypothetical protein EAH88_11870 [Rhodanobacter glycinis]